MRHFLCAFVAAVAIAGCTEPKPKSAPTPVQTPDFEAHLAVTDTLPTIGASVTVYVEVGGKLAGDVASFTTRVAYDTLGLRYTGEVQVGDGATRITNPQPGLIRSAGVAQTGFEGGQLVGYAFTVIRPDAVGHLSLVVDEMHTMARTNVTKQLVTVRSPTIKKL